VRGASTVPIEGSRPPNSRAQRNIIDDHVPSDAMSSATDNDEEPAVHSSTVPPFSIADAAPQGDDAKRTLLPFPTVAIGASAGGVEALLRLFGKMPPDSGCAFVAVMHLDPDRESMMASLLGRATAMPVVQAEDDMQVAANHVYTNPPGHYLELQAGRLVLSDIPLRPPRPKAVDHFMISLAADQRERAIAVVLTGTDGDGALGVKAVKAEGGMTIAQTPGSAAHAGMPQSAIDTGVVDSCLPIDQMPAAILEYVAHAHLQSAPGEAAADEADDVLFELLTELKDRSGLDFRGYKTPMLRRRVHRRMGLAHIGDLSTYLEFLRDTPQEAGALADDFLISVTEFFREPDAWGVLAEEVLPKLLDGTSEGDNLRVWVPACATGEEAYSMAMLLMENPRVAERRLKLQVFATDVDRRALDFARAGRYPATIEQAVSAQRRRRFFSQSEGHYQVRKELREAVLFAPHDLVNDPPFSHMDLVSCRNLLIYLEPELQRRLLQVFHFALEPDGCLFLGKSETVGSQAAQFAPASQRSRIFRCIGPGRLAAGLKLPAAPPRRLDTAVRLGSNPRRGSDHARLIRDALLESSSSAGILTNPQGQALYFYGPVRPYVEQPEGSPTSDLYSVLRDELRPHVRALIHRAATERQRAEATVGIPLEGEGEQPVRLVAAPVPGGAESDLLLLSFERIARAPLAVRTPLDDSSALHALEDELRDSKRQLRSVIEELEAANEELKVANEEAMSMNEELQSTNEELETSKEELQSVNEELSTVNNQLQIKVHELESANNDLGNLLASTHTPTLFLDRRMRVKRFTPAATQLFSLLPGDLNRPLTDIASRCDMRALQRDAERVLSELAPLQEEVRSDDGRFYLRRTLPYRTHEDRIEGIVVTFTDITELKRAAEDLRRFAAVVRSSNDAIIVHDVAGKVLAWNRGAQALYGYSEAATLGTPIMMLLPPDARGAYEEQMRRALAGELVQGVPMRRRTRDGRLIDVSATLSAVQGDDGTPNALALIERDITQQLRADADLRASEQRFRTLADSAPALIWISDAEGRLSFTNRECTLATGHPPDRLQGQRWTDLLHPDDLPHVQTATWRAGRDGTGRIETTARLLPYKGEARWVKIVALTRADDATPGLVGCMFDIDAQMGAEEALRLANQRKDEFLAMLGHELRNPLVPIRNAAEVLKKVGGSDARVAWVRDTLVRQVEHVTRLVDDLLDISRVTRGTMSLHLEPVELGGVIARAVDSTRPLLERKRHRFDLREPDEALWVEGDAIRLAQIFENLLTNAAKYTDEGGELSLKLAREGNAAVVHVRDNGIGIAPGMQGRVFDLFVQDQRSVDRSQGGLGIGLALVRHLVELHGGTVSAESPGSGKGSDFVVSLPLLPAAAVPAPAVTASPDTSAGGRVLVLDDDVDGSESLAVLLRLYGFKVETAHDLDSGLRAAAGFAPQVVMLDLAMPGADGYEIARRLRAIPALANTQYVVLSGFGAAEDLARSRLAGFAHHFVKPADPQEVQALLTRLIAQQGAGETG